MDNVTVNPGEKKTAFWYINLSGRLFFKITNKSGTNLLSASWIKGPFGSEENIGELTGSGKIDFKGILWGKLKVFDADSATVIQVSEDALVAHNFPPVNF